MLIETVDGFQKTTLQPGDLLIYDATLLTLQIVRPEMSYGSLRWGRETDVLPDNKQYIGRASIVLDVAGISRHCLIFAALAGLAVERDLEHERGRGDKFCFRVIQPS